jgi:AraC family transcriptional regulator
MASPVSPSRGGLTPARLRRVLEHVRTELVGDTSLHRLAELAGLSPCHFALVFRQSTGLPPHRYVLQQRVERAKALLANPQLSLAEVGYAVGFASQAHFTTVFRKLVGATPATYRKGRRASRAR